MNWAQVCARKLPIVEPLFFGCDFTTLNPTDLLMTLLSGLELITEQKMFWDPFTMSLAEHITHEAFSAKNALSLLNLLMRFMSHCSCHLTVVWHIYILFAEWQPELKVTHFLYDWFSCNFEELLVLCRVFGFLVVSPLWEVLVILLNYELFQVRKINSVWCHTYPAMGKAGS